MTEKKKPETTNQEEAKKGSWKERLKSLSPVLAVVLVAACAASSIAGYVPASYEIPVVEAAAEEEEETVEKGSFDLDDGYYEGTGVGYSGNVVVGVTIASQQITTIDVLEESDDEAFFNRAMMVIDDMIEQQTVDVDVISEATYSSRGIINAVKNALYGIVDENEIANTTSSEGDAEVEEVEEADGYIDGTYYGSAQGFSGTVTVKVVIEDGKIASITVVSHSDDSSYFNKAKTLISKIISGQTTNVDVVSGASYSSAGIINAVRDALSQAAADGSSTEETAEITVASSSGTSSAKRKTVTAGTSGNFPYPDGTYTGTGEGWGGDIVVSVTIKDQSITSITIDSAEDETEEYFSKAKVLTDEIVTAQSTDLDVVSGATYSSNGILDAVNDALAQAAAAAEGTSSGSSSSGSSSSGSSSSGSSGSGNSDSGSSSGSGSVCAGTGDNSSDDDSSADTAEAVFADGTYTISVQTVPDEDEDFEEYSIRYIVTIADNLVTSITYEYDESDEGYDDLNETYIEYALNGRTRRSVWYEGLAAQAAALTVSQLQELLQTEDASEYEGLDAVSSATCSSNAIKTAVKEALALAAAEAEEEGAEAEDGEASAAAASGTSGEETADGEESSTGADSDDAADVTALAALIAKAEDEEELFG